MNIVENAEIDNLVEVYYEDGNFAQIFILRTYISTSRSKLSHTYTQCLRLVRERKAHGYLRF